MIIIYLAIQQTTDNKQRATMINPLDIISEFYDPNAKTYRILVQHGEQVAEKAMAVAGRVAHLRPDLRFIEEAAMLHDIGIFLISAPELGCTGESPYVLHGYLGRKLLEAKGLPDMRWCVSVIWAWASRGKRPSSSAFRNPGK